MTRTGRGRSRRAAGAATADDVPRWANEPTAITATASPMTRGQNAGRGGGSALMLATASTSAGAAHRSRHTSTIPTSVTSARPSDATTEIPQEWQLRLGKIPVDDVKGVRSLTARRV